ncbi:hypothetical protein [Sinomonas mesophila]|uniref:hypothetical protein n=1 Tax=Sinomonas mesophila TaxID=1531955 RepID=UPI001115629C|nr:hypothetical protein [Sinomonas mesophila]
MSATDIGVWFGAFDVEVRGRAVNNMNAPVSVWLTGPWIRGLNTSGEDVYSLSNSEFLTPPPPLGTPAPSQYTLQPGASLEFVANTEDLNESLMRQVASWYMEPPKYSFDFDIDLQVRGCDTVLEIPPGRGAIANTFVPHPGAP